MKVIEKKRARLLHGDMGTIASVEIEGHIVSFSRYDDETKWYADSHFGPNGYPYFAHGEGSRCCMKKTTTPEMEKLIDEYPLDN